MTSWRDEAWCKNMPLESFFEAYENDKHTADEVDQLCFACPVREACLQEAVNTSDIGVRGGVYLMFGKYSRSRNSHKGPYVAKKLQAEVQRYNESKS